MKAGKAQIGIFQKIRIIKFIQSDGSVRCDFKKTVKRSRNHLIRNFLRNVLSPCI